MSDIISSSSKVIRKVIPDAVEVGPYEDKESTLLPASLKQAVIVEQFKHETLGGPLGYYGS